MNYDSTMEALRKTYEKPVFGFEVGQFEVLPDFGELNDFHGMRGWRTAAGDLPGW
ncbi:MAG: hypothetical protein LUH00_01105 [Lachnospiraceae bacterium]|nr:hypothetical protein [Lachnospiraceae bacterium]